MCGGVVVPGVRPNSARPDHNLVLHAQLLADEAAQDGQQGDGDEDDDRWHGRLHGLHAVHPDGDERQEARECAGQVVAEADAGVVAVLGRDQLGEQAVDHRVGDGQQFDALGHGQGGDPGLPVSIRVNSGHAVSAVMMSPAPVPRPGHRDSATRPNSRITKICMRAATRAC